MNYRNDGRFAGGLGYSNVSRQQGGFTPTRNFRQDSHVAHHNIGELESILERERVKFKQTREKLENQLDIERKKRIDFQNRLIKLKDQLSKKDLQISELQFRNNNILHQNQDLSVDNEKLRNELERMQSLYGERIANLQAQLDSQTRQFEETTTQYNNQFERFKKEGQQYVETLTFEYERKIKSLEDKLKTSESSRKDMAFDNKKLNDLINQNRLAFEEEIRDITNRVRDEEQKKLNMLSRSHDQKLKNLEQARDTLNRRCQQYLRIIQQKDRQIQEYNNSKSNDTENLQQEIADLTSQISQMSFINEKLKTQIHEKESAVARIKGEASQQNQYLRQQLDQKKKEVEGLNIAVREMRDKIKDVEIQSENKRKQLVEKANYYELQCRKYKDQCTRICETLKSKVNETITNVGYKR